MGKRKYLRLNFGIPTICVRLTRDEHGYVTVSDDELRRIRRLVEQRFRQLSKPKYEPRVSP